MGQIWKTSRDVVVGAYEEIMAYRDGRMRPAKTGFKFIDDAMLGGLYPRHAIAIGARPGVGKSYLAQRIMSNVMDTRINPGAVNYAWVRCEFEMNPVDLMLRSISRGTGKDMRDILIGEMSDSDFDSMRSILRGESSKRIFYIDKPTSAETMRDAIWEMMGMFKDKEMVFFSIDHTALIQGRGSTKDNIDYLISVCNEAKLTFPNIFFLMISQLNREIDGRKDPKEQAPRQSDFYQSDTLGQLCSLMIAINIPSRYGYDKYMRFPETWFKNLDRFKSKDKRSFETEGLVFNHIVKVRRRMLEEIESLHIETMRGYESRYPESGTILGQPSGDKDTEADNERKEELPGLFGDNEEIPF